MKLAARLLFRGGKRILLTDLTWPSYEKILQREARKGSGQIECLPVRTLRREISGTKCTRVAATAGNQREFSKRSRSSR